MSRFVRLTSRGEDTARRATQAIQAAEQASLASLSVGERVMLAELLHKVAGCRGAVDAAES